MTEFQPLKEGTAAEVVTLVQQLASANRGNALLHKQVVTQYELCIKHLEK